MAQAERLLTIDELRSLVAAGKVDTVVVAITDMQGRLQGKRRAAKYFLDVVVPHAVEGCNYLLAGDVDMRTVGGYAMSSWEGGYGDFVLQPDLDTLRLMPWYEGTALVLCDVEWEGGRPVVASPRQILRRQIERLAERNRYRQTLSGGTPWRRPLPARRERRPGNNICTGRSGCPGSP